MKRRPLGQSGIEASVVALGAWGIGGWMWGGTEEKESVETIHAAIDAGIDFIDTAPIYGFGLSEELVGKAIRDRRDKVILATKCGMVANTRHGEHKFNSNALGPDPNGLVEIYQYLSPESIRREVERSLKRLQTDYIDLYQTHWQEEETPRSETMQTLMKLKEEGKIRAIGVSNCRSAQMDEYREIGPIASDQEKYSMLDRDIENEQLPYCREHNIAVLAYSPLAQGLLTGKVTPEREFEEGDQRRNDPRFSIENRKRILEMLDKFKPIAEDHEATFAQLTIAWTVQQPGLTHALVGARHPEQARQNARGGSIDLSEDELNQINESIQEYLAAGVS